MTCEHRYRPQFCRDCHRQYCDLPHDSYRGWGCDENDHEHCSGFTRGYETYICDCICCCTYWPTPKTRPTPTPTKETPNE